MSDDHSQRLRGIGLGTVLGLLVLAVSGLWVARNVHFSLVPVVAQARYKALEVERDLWADRAAAAEAALADTQARLSAAEEAQTALSATVATHERDLKRLGSQFRSLQRRMLAQQAEERELRTQLAAALAAPRPTGPGPGPRDEPEEVAERARRAALRALGISVAEAPQASLRRSRDGRADDSATSEEGVKDPEVVGDAAPSAAALPGGDRSAE